MTESRPGVDGELHRPGATTEDELDQGNGPEVEGCSPPGGTP